MPNHVVSPVYLSVGGCRSQYKHDQFERMDKILRVKSKQERTQLARRLARRTLLFRNEAVSPLSIEREAWTIAQFIAIDEEIEEAHDTRDNTVIVDGDRKGIVAKRTDAT